MEFTFFNTKTGDIEEGYTYKWMQTTSDLLGFLIAAMVRDDVMTMPALTVTKDFIFNELRETCGRKISSEFKNGELSLDDIFVHSILVDDVDVDNPDDYKYVILSYTDENGKEVVLNDETVVENIINKKKYSKMGLMMDVRDDIKSFLNIYSESRFSPAFQDYFDGWVRKSGRCTIFNGMSDFQEYLDKSGDFIKSGRSGRDFILKESSYIKGFSGGCFNEVGSLNCYGVFLDEDDFQGYLANYLIKSGKYDTVHLEYFVPEGALADYPCKPNDLYVDIVVERGGEYLPVELKYKTKKAIVPLVRFDSFVGFHVFADQKAYPQNIYNFGKDVRRVELIRDRFSNVKNGLVVFLTNDPAYVPSPNNSRKSAMSAIGRKVDRVGKNDEFRLSRQYDVSWWRDCKCPLWMGGIDFYCTILEV